jgi:hypothetical protein
VGFSPLRHWRAPPTYGFQESLPPDADCIAGTRSGGYGGFYGGNVNLLGVQ